MTIGIDYCNHKVVLVYMFNYQILWLLLFVFKLKSFLKYKHILLKLRYKNVQELMNDVTSERQKFHKSVHFKEVTKKLNNNHS